MLAGWTGRSFGALVALTVALASGPSSGAAEAATKTKASRSGSHVVASSQSVRSRGYPRHFAYRGHSAFRRWASVLQCVPFARENSGIELTGNAGTWWDGAEGLYQRGAKPEVGSILNFRSTGRMRMGHVAVVTNVIDARHIEIDHANWSGPGRITREIDVVDVSPSNDWTAVRVAIGRSDEDFGSTYPTYGFIYDRPDSGTMVANAGVIATPPGTTIHLRPIEVADVPEEVAEAADDTAPRAYRHRSRTRVHTAAQTPARGHVGGSPGVVRASTRSIPVAHHPRRRS